MAERRKLTVAVTRRLPKAVEARMAELFDVRLNPDDHAPSRAELARLMGEADVLVPTITDRIDAELLAAAGGRLRLIANYGNGVDNIDVAAAHARGLLVTNTPNVLDEDTADMTMALILAVPRRLVEGAARLTGGAGWPGWSPEWMLGRRIAGKKLGIVGMGRIGTAVARRARAFGLEIHYHNRRRVDPRTQGELKATYWESLDQMLAHMDIVSVNCPYTPATYHLLSARRLALMPAHAVVVNTARGEIIDEDALVRLIEDGRLAGAGLDVFGAAPGLDRRLLALAADGRVVLLPHMASATVEGRLDMGECVIINIRTLMDGHRPPNRILPGRA